jgi:hypothetical protein
MKFLSIKINITISMLLDLIFLVTHFLTPRTGCEVIREEVLP